jgi:uncharacterized protein
MSRVAFGNMKVFSSESNEAWETPMDASKKERLYSRGLDAFNSSRFYDAHEHWEEVWLKAVNPEKMFLQGLIQVAAAFHHHSRANFLGTRNLLREGLLKLDRFPEIYGDLEIEALRITVREWLADFDTGKIPTGRKVPRITRNAFK